MPRILYRADGGHPVGMGHIQRALRVAAAWAEACREVSVLLVARDHPAARRLISESAPPNLAARFLDRARLQVVPVLEASVFAEIVEEDLPDVIVVDMLDTPESDMRRLRDLAPMLVSLDDRGPGRVYSDLICSFLVRDPDPSVLDAERTWLREGPEYASLAAEFIGVSRPRAEPDRVGRVLVSMGGADAVGLAVKVAEDLLLAQDLREVDFTLGPAFEKRADLERLVAGAPWNASLHLGLPSLLPLYGDADLAIVAGGITMHEAACCGAPAVAVCQPIDHQFLVAAWLEQAGCMLSLGYGESLAPGEITAAVRMLSQDRARRQAMSGIGPRVCDGRGSQRLAELILERWRRMGSS